MVGVLDTGLPLKDLGDVEVMENDRLVPATERRFDLDCERTSGESSMTNGVVIPRRP
jgi:hypothetical protein